MCRRNRWLSPRSPWWLWTAPSRSRRPAPARMDLSATDRSLYVGTVMFGAATTGALIGPVSLHRLLAGRQLKPQTEDHSSLTLAAGRRRTAMKPRSDAGARRPSGSVQGRRRSASGGDDRL
ncbi:DUF6328 family protein [Streptomyces laculatispora]|uniref:DUF6328 family protein n=1 Tax=Streptomyces laculatispora TaxID=887464 RepID=UPI003555EC6E